MSNSVGFLQQSVTAAVAASTTVASFQFTGQGESQGDSARIYNSTNGIAFVVFGKGAAPGAAIVASGSSGPAIPIPPGGSSHDVSYVRKIPGYDWVSVILNTGATAGVVYVTLGDGGV